MADVLNTVCLHFNWSTYDRQPFLTPQWRTVIFDEIATQAADCGCAVVAIGCVEDHIHVLVRYGTTASISHLVKQMKGASSRRVNASSLEAGGMPFFKWQGSYAVFPVEPGSKDRIADYVRGQEQHHRLRTLERELEAAQR